LELFDVNSSSPTPGADTPAFLLSIAEFNIYLALIALPGIYSNPYIVVTQM
jgi:hypothetical protein